jgi:hypothetical protein
MGGLCQAQGQICGTRDRVLAREPFNMLAEEYTRVELALHKECEDCVPFPPREAPFD